MNSIKKEKKILTWKTKGVEKPLEELTEAERKEVLKVIPKLIKKEKRIINKASTKKNILENMLYVVEMLQTKETNGPERKTIYQEQR